MSTNSKSSQEAQGLLSPLHATKKEVDAIIPGVGDEGCLLPSPSGINTLPIPVQFLIFVGISISICLGTKGTVFGFESLQSAFPDSVAIWKKTFPLLGIIFTAAGIAHFTICDEFCNLMPQTGSWGFWYLPGSKKFHVWWTGIAEIIGGLWVILGGLSNVFGLPLPALLGSNVLADGATWLFVLVVLVTPANIYSLTHGARLPMNGPPIPIVAHIIRLALQCVLLAQFYEMALPTLGQFLTL